MTRTLDSWVESWEQMYARLEMVRDVLQVNDSQQTPMTLKSVRHMLSRVQDTLDKAKNAAEELDISEAEHGTVTTNTGKRQ